MDRRVIVKKVELLATRFAALSLSFCCEVGIVCRVDFHPRIINIDVNPRSWSASVSGGEMFQILISDCHFLLGIYTPVMSDNPQVGRVNAAFHLQ